MNVRSRQIFTWRICDQTVDQWGALGTLQLFPENYTFCVCSTENKDITSRHVLSNAKASADAIRNTHT